MIPAGSRSTSSCTTPTRTTGPGRRDSWSTFGSAQADPYAWGTARLDGYVPPAGRPTADADIPHEAARSEDVLASVAQARRTGVPLACGPRIVG
jgi:mycothiol S-conjugate amidase